MTTDTQFLMSGQLFITVRETLFSKSHLGPGVEPVSVPFHLHLNSTYLGLQHREHMNYNILSGEANS